MPYPRMGRPVDNVELHSVTDVELDTKPAVNYNFRAILHVADKARAEAIEARLLVQEKLDRAGQGANSHDDRHPAQTQTSS